MLLSIRLVKEYGYLSRLPYSEELEDGIFELRAKADYLSRMETK